MDSSAGLPQKQGFAFLLAALFILAAALGWWWTRGASPSSSSSSQATIGAGTPFSVLSCDAESRNSSASLKVSFSEPVSRAQTFEDFFQVIDLGNTDSEAVQKGKGDISGEPAPNIEAEVKKGLQSGEKLIQGSWFVEGDPHTLNFPYVSSGHKYRIRFAPGLLAQSGEKLEKSRAESASCEVLAAVEEASFFFSSKGTILPAKQNGGLPVTTVNVPEVDVEFLRVDPAHLPVFAERVLNARQSAEGCRYEDGDDDCYSFYYQDRRDYQGITYNSDLNALRDMASSVYLGRFLTSAGERKAGGRTVTFLPVENIRELQESGIYIAVMGRPGDFDNRKQVTYFYVSDIGLHARRYKDGIELFATSLTSGKAMREIEFQLLDSVGKTLARARADESGHASMRGDLSGARLILAGRGKEMSVLALKDPGLDLSEFDIGGHLSSESRIFAYSGRDLYRPGENLSVSMFARDARGHMLAGIPLQAALKRPDGKTVLTRSLAASNAHPGYYQESVALPADAPTGRWTLEVRADPAAKRPDSALRFQVEEFLPERMKLLLESQAVTLKPGESFPVDVHGEYLFGAPAAGNRLLGAMALEREQNPLPERWPGYIFGDFADDRIKHKETVDETALDGEGKGHVELKPDANDAHSPVSVRASFSLLESGGRPVVRSITRTIWPAPALIALRPMFERNVAREKEAAEFALIRVKPGGDFAPLPEAEYRLFLETRQYYWRYDDQKGWHSGYAESDSLIASGKIALQKEAKLSAPVDYGSYRIEVKDPETGQTLRYRFYAGWSAQEAEKIGNRPDHVQMQLEGVPVNFDQGATREVKLTLTPPHDGEALLMVEAADRLLWSKRLPVSARGATVAIPVSKEWERPDIYISAVVFRPGSQGDRVTPARAVGLVHLPFGEAARKLGITVEAPKKAVPERRVEAKIKVLDSAGKVPGKKAIVTLSAVDAGILNITRFATPDPFDFYFGKHYYNPEMLDIYGKLIEKMDGIRGRLKWGGDSGMRDTKSMPKKVKLVDLFSGPVELDANGEAKIPLDLPDFNGTLRLMAVAATADDYGNAEQEMVVAAPIVAELSTPRFITPGDQARLALDLTNLSGAKQKIDVDLSAVAPLSIAGGKRSLTLEDKERAVLRFDSEVSGAGAFGLIPLNLEVKAGEGKDAIRIKRQSALQVQPAIPREQRSFRLKIDPGARVKLDPQWTAPYHRGSATLSVALSNRPPLNVASFVKGLLNYPYGCVEQTVSAAYPHIYIDEEGAKAMGITPHSREERARFISGAIARIAGMQGASGSYTPWGGGGADDVWLTSYVGGFLMDARDAGFEVPEALIKRTEEWMLKKLLDAGRNFPSMPAYLAEDTGARHARSSDIELMRFGSRRFAELAHLSYILAREQKAPLAGLRLLHDKYRNYAHSPLPLVHLALALSLSGDEKRAREALDDAMKSGYGIPGEYYSYFGDYGSEVRDFARSYALLAQHKMTHPQRENLLFNLVGKLSGGKNWFSTQERLALFLAARAAGEGGEGEWSAALILPEKGKDGSSKGREVIASRGTAIRAFAPLLLDKGIEIENTGGKTLWLEAEAGGYPLKPSMPEGNTRTKITLEHAWFNADGAPWKGGRLRVGDMLIARVAVSSNQIIEDGLVVDPVPAGLEIENLNLSQGEAAGSFNIENENVVQAMNDPKIRHLEYRDDRFVAAARLDGQKMNLYYLLRVVTPGVYTVPAVYAEDMYRPEIRAFGPSAPPVTVFDVEGKN
ncbi:MAG: alpha-2-macroglobulin family protein [Betaproteobacteria bacterium]|nr:alpha-2-macroglobulin family protein [Betaproteobacteria bacterium]